MVKPKILWFGIFSPQVKDIMKENAPFGFELMFVQSKVDREEHLRLLSEADYISPNGIDLTEEYINKAKKLKLIQLWGAGTDAYDIGLLRKLNIGLQNGVGLNSSAVAEMAVLHMLAVSRRLSYVDRNLRQGLWLKTEMRDKCNSVYGKTVGLLGMGNIGCRTAQILHALNVKRIVYYDINRLPIEKERTLEVEYMGMDDVIREADILSLHLPLNENTRKLINRDRLAIMKPEAIIINTARGAIIDEEALIDALKNNKIRGAGLDTFDPEPPRPDNPLFKMDNVVLTSHGAGAVIENIKPRVCHVYDCIVKFENNQPIDSKYIILERKKN